MGTSPTDRLAGRWRGLPRICVRGLGGDATPAPPLITLRTPGTTSQPIGPCVRTRGPYVVLTSLTRLQVSSRRQSVPARPRSGPTRRCRWLLEVADVVSAEMLALKRREMGAGIPPSRPGKVSVEGE